MKVKKTVKAVEQPKQPKFTVKRNKISWKYRRGVIELSVDELDDIFYQYSKHGLNKSQVQVQNHYGFDALQWQSLKRTFDLVKDSDVFSPYSLSLVSDKEACDMIAQKIGEKYSPRNMRAVVEYEDRKQTKKAYEKAIKTAEQSLYERQKFEDDLLEYVVSAKKAPLVKKTRDVRDGNVVVHVCDLHAGADIKETKNLPAYNYGVLEQKLGAISKDVNQRKPKTVKLVLNGDFIETFTGLNHINSWKNIDMKEGYGVKATIKVIDILKKFISDIHNVGEVILISGNHDRVTSNNKEDVEGEVTRLIAYILKGVFEKHFPVKWSPDVVSSEIDDCGFVFTHGHLGISKKTGETIVNMYGNKELYNLIVMGHLHTRKVLSDSYENRVIHAPSIFTGNDYSKGLGYSSRSGYLYITVKDKLPVVTDVPV